MQRKKLNSMSASSQASPAASAHFDAQTEIDESGKQRALELLLSPGPSVPSLEEQEEGYIPPTLPPQLQTAIEVYEKASNGQKSPAKKYNFAEKNKKLLYLAEIESGNRLKNGNRKLDKLKGTHYMCISLHLGGAKQADIAQVVCRSISWVSQTLADPLAKAEIMRRSLMMESDLFALQSDVVEAIRSALRNESEPNIQLKGAEMWLKSQGRFQKTQSSDTFSGEDLVKSILNHEQRNKAAAVAQAAVHNETHVHVHVGEGERITVLPDPSAADNAKAPLPLLKNSE